MARVHWRSYMNLKIAGALGILIVCFSCSTLQEKPPDELVPRASPVQIGELAPNFTLEDQGNQKVSLSAARGNPAILVFYRGYW